MMLALRDVQPAKSANSSTSLHTPVPGEHLFPALLQPQPQQLPQLLMLAPAQLVNSGMETHASGATYPNIGITAHLLVNLALQDRTMMLMLRNVLFVVLDRSSISPRTHVLG